MTTRSLKMGGVLLSAIAAFTFLPARAHAQDEGYGVVTVRHHQDMVGGKRRVGIGVDVGYPFTGGVLKVFVDPRNAFQIEGGYAFGITGRLEYINHVAYLGRNPYISVPFYLGVGVGYTQNANPANGLVNGGVFDSSIFVGNYPANSHVANGHIPIGFAFQLQKAPIDFFIQAEPGIDVIIPPATALGNATVRGNLRAGLGGRLYF